MIHFTLTMRVYDATLLRRHARRVALASGVDIDQLAEYIGTVSEPDIGGCLQMILDPGQPPEGAEIIDSTVENIE